MGYDLAPGAMELSGLAQARFATNVILRAFDAPQGTCTKTASGARIGAHPCACMRAQTQVCFTSTIRGVPCRLKARQIARERPGPQARSWTILCVSWTGGRMAASRSGGSAQTPSRKHHDQAKLLDNQVRPHDSTSFV